MRTLTAASAFFALAAGATPAATAAPDRVSVRVADPPLAYTYLDERHRRPDGTFEYRTFGVWVHVVSSRRDASFTTKELARADVLMTGVRSRDVHRLGFERAVMRGGRRRGVCFHARFVVRPGESRLGRKRPGDSVVVTAELRRPLVARRAVVVRQGNVDGQRDRDRARIRRAGCRPPRRFGR